KKGLYVYEIEVYVQGKEHDVYVDAMTGDIVHVKGKNNVPKSTNNKQSPNPFPKVPINEAMTIASNYVGEGIIDEVELEWIDGIPMYEVEIEIKKDNDIEVKIDGNTGEIIAVDWD